MTSSFVFEIVNCGSAAVYGGFALRPVGGGVLGVASVYRSRELTGITATEATFMVNALGIRSVYDVHSRREVAECPEPYLVGVKMVAVEPRSSGATKTHGVAYVLG